MKNHYKNCIYLFSILTLFAYGCSGSFSGSSAKNGRLVLTANSAPISEAFESPVPIPSSAPAEPVDVEAPSQQLPDAFAEPDIIEEAEPQPIDYSVVKPNEVGQIMIIMYHHIVDRQAKNNLERSVDDFKADLARFYEEGYRLTTIESLINNNIEVEAGYTPVVLTFDDGWSSAFSMTEVDGELVPVKNTAVQIINEFAEERPDFGRTAVFYINGYKGGPFKGEGTVAQKLAYLVDSGYELGNHTWSHAMLSRLNAEDIQNELLNLDLYVKYALPDYKMTTFCYPYGDRPQMNLRPLVLEGEYNDIGYKYEWALREGPSNAVAAPNHTMFDPLNVPRVRGTSNAAMDLGWFFDYYANNPDLKYISDGDPDTISVPADHISQVNQESLNGKILNVY